MDLKNNMAKHNKYLSPYACLDKDAKRIKEEKEDFRTPFFHDIDRILYSYAYMRYMDKTQVFPTKKSDHITRRMLHVQMVSKIARTIGRALNLNEDLIEASALGHDLGHVPFGHFGEAILNEISLKHNEGYFNHNIESVRLLMYIEHKGKGLNLTIQVLDAIMCHNGEFLLGEYRPKEKSIEEFMMEYELSYKDKNIINKLVPMTLEGCVVRISDIIAYLGRDIDDACSLGVFNKKDIPKNIVETLGIHNKTIINTIVNDIINNSMNKPYIKMSKEIYNAIKELKKFNYEHIYKYSLTKEKQKEIKDAFNTVYEYNLEALKNKDKKSDIYNLFYQYKSKNYQKNNSLERICIDYLAGMTDEFLMKSYNEIKNYRNWHNNREV